MLFGKLVSLLHSNETTLLIMPDCLPTYSNITTTGFFYVKNFNISQEEVDKQFALGREFYALPLEEKLKFHNKDDLIRGEYNGYRPAGHRM